MTTIEIDSDDEETLINALSILGAADAKERGVYLPTEDAERVLALRDEIHEQVTEEARE